MMRGLGLHVIQFPSKAWGYVGSIPVDLYWDTEDKAVLEQMAESSRHGIAELTAKRLAVKRRVFPDREAAVAFAQGRGYEVAG